MKNTQVKSHKREGRIVKSHSRTVKGAMKNSGSGMSAEDCKAKYDAMVAKYGENSPQAKKLAMKMESMETVEKESKKMSAGIPKGRKRSPAAEKVYQQQKQKESAKFSAKVARVKKHSRGSYMRKNVAEELLTKESRANNTRKFKKGKDGLMKPIFSKKEKADAVSKEKSMHDKMAALRAKKK